MGLGIVIQHASFLPKTRQFWPRLSLPSLAALRLLHAGSLVDRSASSPVFSSKVSVPRFGSQRRCQRQDKQREQARRLAASWDRACDKPRPWRGRCRSSWKSWRRSCLRTGITPVTVAEPGQERARGERCELFEGWPPAAVNQSRVAAATGLSRAEVRRRLVEPSRNCCRLTCEGARPKRSSPWPAGVEIHLFLDRNWQAEEPCRVRSGASSFAELVRLHSGDIPPRVVLEQFKERGVVRIRGEVVSLKSKPKSLIGVAPNALLDVVPYVSDLLSAAATENSNLAFAQRVSLVVEGESQKILITERVVRALAATASALLAFPSLGEDVTTSIDRTKLTVALTLVSKPIAAVRKR
jgi:hypothetical protein